MAIHKITAVLLILVLVLPSIPAHSDCGCGGMNGLGQLNKSSTPEPASCSSKRESSCDSVQPVMRTCCGKQPASAKASVGCCGQSGDDCRCSNASHPCQCGTACQCGEASESPIDDQPVVPASESDSTSLGIQFAINAALDPTCEDVVNQSQLWEPGSQGNAGCYSSTERCSKLCRFLC